MTNYLSIDFGFIDSVKNDFESVIEVSVYYDYNEHYKCFLDEHF